MGASSTTANALPEDQIIETIAGSVFALVSSMLEPSVNAETTERNLEKLRNIFAKLRVKLNSQEEKIVEVINKQLQEETDRLAAAKSDGENSEIETLKKTQLELDIEEKIWSLKEKKLKCDYLKLQIELTQKQLAGELVVTNVVNDNVNDA